MSEAILKLVRIAEAQGLQFTRPGFEKADVYWCTRAMPPQVRDAGNSDSTLEFLDRPEEPWMPAHRGFFDPNNRVAVVFEQGRR